MGLALEYGNGQTPLDEDEKEGLLIQTIATRGELDEFEQKNIEEAVQWTLTKRIKPESILTEAFIKEVHRKMYGGVWEWAGEFCETNKNIGVDKWEIGTELKKLLDDAAIWVRDKVYSPDEIAVRFKHRLVSIHCFPNGNGRHSRLVADIIVEKIFNGPVFTWGAANIKKEGEARTEYLKALREADAGDYSLLLAFARA